MAQLLGQVAVGSIVKINENGTPVDFYVAKHDYESELNGTGRTLLVRKDVHSYGKWGTVSDYIHGYPSNDLDMWLSNTYRDMLDSNIKNIITSINIKYTNSNGQLDTLSRKFFALSITELGAYIDVANTEGSRLPIASTLQIAYYNGNAANQWTRTINKSNYFYPCMVHTDGATSYDNLTTSSGIRPAFTLPSTAVVSDDGSISSQISPPALTVPANAMQGQSIPINWTASAGADSYQLQRKADSGEWETIYTGSDLTFTDTAGSWSTVQYQVAAGLSGEYGEYATSAVIPVISASALVISGSDEDLGTITADIPYTVTSDTGNQITHTLTVNGVQYTTVTEASGVAHSVPVMDLPTGIGTIVITASVQAASGPVTATRTWTYTKTAQTFPTSAGVGTLAQNGVNILPQTLAECVRTNPFWGGSLSTALEMLTGVVSNGAQIEVGSYVGTGSFGQSSPNRLTFSFKPAMVMIFISNCITISSAPLMLMWDVTAQYSSVSTNPVITNYVSYQGNTVTWYVQSGDYSRAADQLNQSGETYSYIAVG